MNYQPLKVRVEDEEDLKVIAACLQDALISLSGINYDPEAKQVNIVANRFCWECEPQEVNGELNHARVVAGLAFQHVKNVHKKGIDEDKKGHLMSLLTIHNQEKGCINLVFSGGSEIKLEVDKLCCHLKDMDDPYPTSHKPEHSE